MAINDIAKKLINFYDDFLSGIVVQRNSNVGIIFLILGSVILRKWLQSP